MVVLFGKVKEGVGNGGVVRNEVTVEIGKSKEGPYVFSFGRSGPAGNPIEFRWIHGKLSRLDYHVQILYFG